MKTAMLLPQKSASASKKDTAVASLCKGVWTIASAPIISRVKKLDVASFLGAWATAIAALIVIAMTDTAKNQQLVLPGAARVEKFVSQTAVSLTSAEASMIATRQERFVSQVNAKFPLPLPSSLKSEL